MSGTLPLLLPTVPGNAHGIVSVGPPTVQCDGCAATYKETQGMTTSLTHLGRAIGIAAGLWLLSGAAAAHILATIGHAIDGGKS